MAEFVTGIKPISPSYPVKPVQPANKDRESDAERRKRKPPEEQRRPADENDGEDRPTIDEHV